jgi:hypothetical protein
MQRPSNFVLAESRRVIWRLNHFQHRVFARKPGLEMLPKLEAQIEACSASPGSRTTSCTRYLVLSPGILLWFQPETLGKYAPKHLVGRPGLDPGSLGLKETFNRLRERADRLSDTNDLYDLKTPTQSDHSSTWNAGRTRWQSLISGTVSQGPHSSPLDSLQDLQTK